MRVWAIFFLLALCLSLAACSSPDMDEDAYAEGSYEDSYDTGSAEPAPPPPPQPAPMETEAADDDPLNSLRALPIAYEVPETAQVGRSFDVTLAIDATGDDSAADALPARERIIEDTARLTDLVEASLSGSAFEIELTNAARQRLSPVRESVWRWKVTPQQDGPQLLYLEIFAILDNAEAVMLESFDDQITVDIAPEAGESALSANNIRTYISIVGGIISIMLGLIALSAHLRKRGKKADEEAKDS